MILLLPLSLVFIQKQVFVAPFVRTHWLAHQLVSWSLLSFEIAEVFFLASTNELVGIVVRTLILCSGINFVRYVIGWCFSITDVFESFDNVINLIMRHFSNSGHSRRRDATDRERIRVVALSAQIDRPRSVIKIGVARRRHHICRLLLINHMVSFYFISDRQICIVLLGHFVVDHDFESGVGRRIVAVFSSWMLKETCVELSWSIDHLHLFSELGHIEPLSIHMWWGLHREDSCLLWLHHPKIHEIVGEIELIMGFWGGCNVHHLACRPIAVQIPRHRRLFLLESLCVLHGRLEAGVLEKSRRILAGSVIELFVDGVFKRIHLVKYWILTCSINHLHMIGHVLLLNCDIEVLLDVHDCFKRVYVHFWRAVRHRIKVIGAQNFSILALH